MVSAQDHPSADPDGFGSGSRIIRNELNSPINPARIGMSRAICRASGRASVLIRMISAWVCRGLTGELLRERGVAHHLGVVLQRGRDLLLFGWPTARCWTRPCW